MTLIHKRAERWHLEIPIGDKHFKKIARYKTNTQKSQSIPFLFRNDKHAKKEIKESTLLTIALENKLSCSKSSQTSEILYGL